MEEFYKITKAEADQIGYLSISGLVNINPYVGEQKDGTYLISKTCADLIKNHPKLSAINFESKQKKSLEVLDFKVLGKKK